MIRVLLIEIQAFHVFAWAEELLADTDLVAGDGEAARLVSYIRGRRDAARRVPPDGPVRDARPHVVGAIGPDATPATDMIGTLWDRGLEQSLGEGRNSPQGGAR